MRSIKYFDVWLGGLIAIFFLPFEKWEMIKDQKLREESVEMSHRLSRSYALIYFYIIVILLFYGFDVRILWFIALCIICLMSGFASCYRLYKVNKSEQRGFENVLNFYKFLIAGATVFIIAKLIFKIIN